MIGGRRMTTVDEVGAFLNSIKAGSAAEEMHNKTRRELLAELGNLPRFDCNSTCQPRNEQTFNKGSNQRRKRVGQMAYPLLKQRKRCLFRRGCQESSEWCLVSRCRDSPQSEPTSDAYINNLAVF
jgi:hypothetical protein